MTTRKATQNEVALGVVVWLEMNGCTVTISHVGVEFLLHYTLPLDVKPQPAIRIKEDASIVFPLGSQVDVVQAFFERIGKKL